jgi:hypothetical protein
MLLPAHSNRPNFFPPLADLSQTGLHRGFYRPNPVGWMLLEMPGRQPVN